MATPRLRQSAGNAVASGQSRTCTVNLTNPTVALNLVVVVAVAAHSGTSGTTLTGPEGFVLIRERTSNELTVAVWYRESAPPLSSVSVSSSAGRSLQVRLIEYEGAAQTSALDKVTVLTGSNREPYTGTSGTVAQADSIIFAAVANRYASTTQSGFTGGLTRLIESVTPATWGFFQSDPDDRRSRLTIHGAVTAVITSFDLRGLLSSPRNWVAILCTFRGSSSGPARMTSKLGPAVLTTPDAASVLTVFGPLTSANLTSTGISPYVETGGRTTARIGPFNYQYLINGWSGLLIGDDTPYRVESMEGLEGWDVRTSDDDLPRGDGAQRGVDLQSARQVLVKLKVGGTQTEVEQAMEALYRALIPQRDEDWELIWRHPSRPLRILRCRPMSLLRGLSWRETLINNQSFVLRAVDPRHYSAQVHEVQIPVTPAGATEVTVVSVKNIGNGRAYPLIRINGPSSGEPVTRIELVNATANVSFDVAATLPANATLVGDMEARVTAAPRSVVTLDGQTKYGAWQLPREAFYLAPSPEAPDGVNAVYLRTTPAGADVTATIEYRDTSSG